MTATQKTQKILLIAHNIPQVYVALAVLPILARQFAGAAITVLTRAKHFQQFQHDASDENSKPRLISVWPAPGEVAGCTLLLAIGHSYFFSEELLHQFKQVSCPVYWINAHFEQADLLRWRQHGLPVAAMFAGIFYDHQEDKPALLELGVPAQHLHFSGNAKYDCAAASPWQIAQAKKILDSMRADGHTANPVTLVAASLADISEMALIVGAYQTLIPHYPALRLVLAPRSLDHIGEFTSWLKQHDLPCRRSSAPPGSPCAILLVDEVGTLKGYYHSAAIAIMGRSFFSSSRGGSNLLEPAEAGIPIICGPFMDGFTSIMSFFLQHDAVLQLPAPEQLPHCLNQLLENPLLSAAYGARAKSLLHTQTGALALTARKLAEMCDPSRFLALP
ncbi:glycosyltransferase N-terminal domain-containing protein [Undibacterium sp. TS12]|uniref:3-deoxy-D-manno-octulosonic acid transferase n=1 Tax=Undibacterium sp. TS12 TaxID=2908202 RepID=UPI001F4C80D4|nr:glycosyltransferase N-terminal domain-containing protein [Undibacterium sp. TS12]MCH8622534.1 hypothetical protein [Undibacterium sp. TS12]